MTEQNETLEEVRDRITQEMTNVQSLVATAFMCATTGNKTEEDKHIKEAYDKQKALIESVRDPLMTDTSEEGGQNLLGYLLYVTAAVALQQDDKKVYEAYRKELSELEVDATIIKESLESLDSYEQNISQRKTQISKDTKEK